MSDAPSLRETQRRIVRLSNYEDGLWDLLLGAVFMLLAFYPVTRARLGPACNVALFVGLVLGLVLIQQVARRWISTPRLGYVKSKQSPGLKLILAATILLAGLTFGLVILTLTSPGRLPDLMPSGAPDGLRSYLVDILVLLAMAGLFSAMGYLFGVPRLFLYGWLLGGANLAGVILYRGASEGFNVPLGLAAGVILLIGVTLLIRLTRKYPMRNVEA